ncbi:hypothetical protein, conserved [Eimeria tenella]|uniref:BIR protein n=1 Tax=Eimeria tenella TaxID=5802 RepID=U6L241_EIMTE|nr:hypothetical protein, conserved [Eimeria tenella]CDJ42669.1 hypothetical protein, conserved [Eimeria tenella]|eukprot:XP_013233419.1 hypothetical protein, conserved [Eimeria tenella]
MVVPARQLLGLWTRRILDVALGAYGFCLQGREARAVPWEPRELLLQARKEPRYMAECKGTPRMEYPENMIDGVRLRPTFNPYVRLTKAKRYVLDNWPSRNWADWNPYSCFVRGSRRRYQIPKDLMPCKDELGEWHPPRLSGRYKADVERQYRLNGLEWVWTKYFYKKKVHFQDREPLGPKRWYIREFRQQQVREAMRKMADLVAEYRQEVRDKQHYNWFERVVHDFAGEQLSSEYLRSRKEPKL